MDAHFRPLVKRAVEIAGSQQKLAKAIGISQQRVSHLLTTAPKISAEIAVAIDRFTKGAVSKEALRPDLFGLFSKRGRAA